MSVLRQVELGIQIYIFRARWFIAILAVLCGAYIGISNTRLIEASQQSHGNLWDILFIVTCNPFFVLIPFGLVFAFLVSDVSVESDFGRNVVSRLPSRTQWWLGKTCVTACSALIFTVLQIGGIALITVSSFGWASDWSVIAHADPVSINLTPWIMQIPPLLALIFAVVLLFLGAFTVGLLVQVTVVFTGKPLYGFGAAFVVVFAAIAVNNFGLTATLPNIFIHMHWVLSTHSDTFPISLSIIYWLICIAVLVPLGLWASQHMDFI